MSEADMIIESLKNSGKKVEEFYMSNKTSDINVANIQDDVKIVKEFIDYAQGIIEDMEYERPVDVTVYQKELTSMTNILAEREQKDKRIQELEIKLKCAKGLYDDCCKCLVDSIPKQVVIDAINKHKLAYEELGIKYTNTHYEDDEKRARDFYMIVTEDRIIQVLQELLGEEKNRNV